MEVVKKRDHLMDNGTLSLDMPESDFDVDWRAICPKQNSSGIVPTWISCEPSSGRLLKPITDSTADSTASKGVSVQLKVLVNASGMRDYSVDNDQNTYVQFNSSVVDKPGLAFNGKEITMEVRVRIIAHAYLRLRDVKLIADKSKEVSVESVNGTLVSMASDSSGSLTVSVKPHDCEGLEIKSLTPPAQGGKGGQNLYVELHRENGEPVDGKSHDMHRNLNGNSYEAQLPSTLFESGTYQIHIFTLSETNTSAQPYSPLADKDTDVWFRFRMEKKTSSLLTIGIIISVLLGVLLLALVLLVVKKRNKARELVTAFLKFESIVSAETAFEIWDVVGDGLCLSIVLRDPDKDAANYYAYRYGFIGAFATSLIAALIALVPRFVLFVKDMHRRIRRKPPGLSRAVSLLNPPKQLKQREENYKLHLRKAETYLVVSLFEDLPMGVLDFMYLLRMLNSSSLPDSKKSDSLNMDVSLLLVSFGTSLIMLGYKLGYLPKVKELLEERKRLKKLRRPKMAKNSGMEMDIIQYGESIAQHNGKGSDGGKDSDGIAADPMHSDKEVTAWGVEDVAMWMTSTVRLPEYAQAFRDFKVDGDMLQDMDAAQLEKYGISNTHDQAIILSRIEKLALRD
jgi:hypothetical protein